jgi:hypothetical protein
MRLRGRNRAMAAAQQRRRLEWLTTAQAADVLCLSESALKVRRHRGAGPEWVRIDGRVVYSAMRLRLELELRGLRVPEELK